MTPIKWFPFKGATPKKNHAIMICDHEGNMCPGVWRTSFVPFVPIPVGALTKWAYVKVLIIPSEETDIIDPEYIWFENGEKIRLQDLYDFEEPFKDVQK